MRASVVVILAVLLAACGGPVTVKMQSSPPPSEGLLAQVRVKDLRTQVDPSRRTTLGMPMGNISFDPPEAQLVKNMLETNLTRILRERGVQTPQVYDCDIAEFGVNTASTPLYWDVIGRVHLVLRHEGKQYDFTGSHTERTYVWPGEEIIRKVVEESLKQIAAELANVT